MGSQLLPCYPIKHGGASLLFLLLLLLAHALPLAVAQSNPDPAANDPYSTVKFSPPLAVTIVVLITCFFFVGIFSICMRHCSDSDYSSTVRPAGARANRSRRGAARGLDKEVLETFPTFVYSEVKTQKIGKGALECAVCLNEFEDDETLRLIPKCDHVFHPECIDAWLESHTTCPVCRANLGPEPGESTLQATELHSQVDLEAQQNDAAASETQPQGSESPEPQVVSVNWANQTLNRNRTRGSRSGKPRKFRRSHTTGHSLVQPGENTERFTLRLPVDVRKKIMNRSNSLVVLPREPSSRRGYRAGGGGEGSSRGRNSRRWLDRSIKSDRWVLSMAPPFFQRASSLKATKVAVDDDNKSLIKETSSSAESSRPPV